MIEVINLNNNFTLEVCTGNYPDCDLYFSNGKGYYSCDDSANISLNQAKEIIAALTKFVEAKEKETND